MDIIQDLTKQKETEMDAADAKTHMELIASNQVHARNDDLTMGNNALISRRALKWRLILRSSSCKEPTSGRFKTYLRRQRRDVGSNSLYI